MKRYIFKTFSGDPRPIIHCLNWFVIGIGEMEGKKFWYISAYLFNTEIGDIYRYWPEAFDISLGKEDDFEVVRGGKHYVIPALRSLEFSDGINYFTKEISQTALFTISKLSEMRLSDTDIARRLNLTLHQYRSLQKNPLVKTAINSGYQEYLNKVLKSIDCG